jgi:hypothetical protein
MSGLISSFMAKALAFAMRGIVVAVCLFNGAAQAQTIIAPSIDSVTSFYGSRSPTNLVNGTGLTAGPSGILGAADSTHGNDVDATMWYSNPFIVPADTSPIVTFNLGGVYDLQTTRLWQYNEPPYAFTVYGAKDIEVAVSSDNTNFTVLTTITLARAGGTNGEPAQDFAAVAPGVRYVRLHVLDTFAGAAASGLSEVRFVGAASGYGGPTLYANATTVQLANDVQKVSFDKGPDGKFHVTTSVWDGSNWRPFFDAQRPLIEGSAFNLEPTSYTVRTNTATKKLVRFQGARTSPSYSFDLMVEMETGSDLARFELINHLTNGLTLSGQQPTVGLWMNRPSAQWVMDQGGLSPTRVAFPPDFNIGFPAAYLYDQQQEAAIFFDLTPATWMRANGVNRFSDVQARTWGNGTQTALGLYRYHVTGNFVPAGDMTVVFYLYSRWRPQGPAQLSDMLDRTLEQFQPLHPGTSVFPTNTLEGGEVSWSKFADRTMADLMVQNVTYGHRTNEPYTDSPLPLVTLPTEMIVHPSFATTNASEALNAWSFATINFSLAPSILYSRLYGSAEAQHFVRLKKDALPRFYSSDSRIIAGGTQQPAFVFGLELSWQTLAYYQMVHAAMDSLAKEDFNPAIGGRWLMGLEGLMQYARQVNYVFSVFYDPFTKLPVVWVPNPGLGAIREPWSVGHYCYVLLGAYDFTGEQRYLTEAQTAMDALMTTMSYTESNSFYTATYSDPMEMPVTELMGNSYGAVAAAKLHRLTSDPKYLTYQRDFLNVLLRMTTWFEDQTDTRSRDVRSLGLFYPFVAAPTPTAWETAEANLCLAWLLKNDRTNSRAPLLARLSNLNRINSFYFYPATFTPEIRSINPGLRTDVGQYFPTENMYTLEFPSGSGGSPNQTAIYMTGLGLWNSWLYEALAAATDRSVLVLNLASLEDYEQSLRSATREFLVCNPTTAIVSTTITNQALAAGTYQVTLTDPAGGVLWTTNQTHLQLLAGLPVTFNSQQVSYLKIENTNSASILADIESYRAAGRKLSHAYQLLQEEARDLGIGTNVLQLQILFGSAYQAYQSSNYPIAFAQANQIVTNLLLRPPPVISLALANTQLRAPGIASFSSCFGSRSPTNLVNGSGLALGASGILGAADSTHGNDTEGSMWYSNPFSTPADTSPVVTFDLGGVADLLTTRIWQYNQPGGFAVYGAKNIHLSVSANNTNYTALTMIAPRQAGGTNGEPAQDFTTLASGIRYVRMQITNTFGGVAASGLAEVRFITKSTGVDLKLTGLQGEHYRIEYSDSLGPAVSWELLQDIPSLGSSPQVINDPRPLQAQRFYRAVEVR